MLTSPRKIPVYRMRSFLKITLFAAGLLLGMTTFAGGKGKSDIRLLYWNIQNGMWSDQQNGYDNFVEFVKAQHPDICVWCEAASIFRSGTDDKIEKNDDKYLPYNWDSLAERYGHSYVYIGGWRDDYPQVITSRYPIRNVKRILGNPEDVIVSHGSAWAQIELQGETLNIVTLHTYPHQFAYMAADKEKSAAENGGHHYRAREMKYICEQTILSDEGREEPLWLMMGDFNSRSRVDSAAYNYPSDSPAYLVHDYIRGNTPYLDVTYELNGGQFVSSTASQSRIDFIYASPAMFNCIDRAEIMYREGWLSPVRDPEGLSNFYHPSDHRPILVEFNLFSLSCTNLESSDI